MDTKSDKLYKEEITKQIDALHARSAWLNSLPPEEAKKEAVRFLTEAGIIKEIPMDSIEFIAAWSKHKTATCDEAMVLLSGLSEKLYYYVESDSISSTYARQVIEEAIELAKKHSLPFNKAHAINAVDDAAMSGFMDSWQTSDDDR